MKPDRLRAVILTAALWITAALDIACFQVGSPIEGGVVSCAAPGDCPSGLVCLLAAASGRCVSPDQPCIEPGDGSATPTADGTSCGDGGICIDAVCQSPRCGDLVVTSPETCDGTEGCRGDCTRCGDGAIDDGEACDNGAQNSDAQAGACRSSCVLAACGDGVRDPGEGCDDGEANADGEADACRSTCARSTCGDGVRDANEACDDGGRNANTANACRPTCALPACGDGVLDDGEACDNGAQNSDIRAGACRTTCRLAACGDGVRDPGEGCDDGGENSDSAADACRTTCAPSTCGDGLVDDGEACDEGLLNADAADACRPTCALPACGDGTLDTGEACDSGPQNSDGTAGACRTSCRQPACGDAVRDPGEACDEGGLNSDVTADACRLDCTRAGCGDGVVDSGEVCDDGNARSGDGCRGDCGKVEVCGDAVVDVGEACDDANENPRDGCDACAQQTWTFSVVVDGASELATQTALANPTAVHLDRLGRLFVADEGTHTVYRLEVDGRLSVIAGTGVAGFSGDFGPATAATLNAPSGLVVDAFGRLLIADRNNHRIRRVDLDGTISTIVGSGVQGFLGDGDTSLAATQARLNGPRGLTLDNLGFILFADTGNHRVRRVAFGPGVAEKGIVSTVAGTGVAGFSGDSGLPQLAQLNAPNDVAFDPTATGSIVILDGGNGRVRRIPPGSSFIITSHAGLSFPNGVAVDPTDCAGGCATYVTEGFGARVKRLLSFGQTATVAGTGSFAFFGEGVPATSAGAGVPTGISARDGRFVFADSQNKRIRAVDTSSIIRTVAGSGRPPSVGDGSFPTSATLVSPGGIAFHPSGSVLLADRGNGLVRTFNAASPTMQTLAGGGSALSAVAPQSVAFSEIGVPIFVDAARHTVARADLTGIAGVASLQGGFAGDGGEAVLARLNTPTHFDPETGLICDTGNHRIRRVQDGVISTVVGDGVAGFGGDGGEATTASLNGPRGTVRVVGGFVVADTENHRLRLVTDAGIIETIAGTGTAGFNGDGLDALATTLSRPINLVVDAVSGDLFFTDAGNHRVRRLVAETGTIVTVAGSGVIGSSGDGGPATSAAINTPYGIAFDDRGRLVFSDEGSGRVRAIDELGVITTIAGAIDPPGPANLPRARLLGPRALLRMSDDRLVIVGDGGRSMVVDETSARVFVGHADGSATGTARFRPPQAAATGVTLDPVLDDVVIAQEFRTLQRIDAVDDAAVVGAVSAAVTRIAGVTHDALTDGFLVVDSFSHTIELLNRNGQIIALNSFPIFGTRNQAGSLPGFLNGPTQVAISPVSGALYIADTGNHRIVRFDRSSGDIDIVVGTGLRSSAGDGGPARTLPVSAPHQLHVDGFGNLFVTSTDTVRLVVNVDGDDDADGDDEVVTIFGASDRNRFPESGASCLEALVDGPDDQIFVADACLGFLVSITPTTTRP